MLRIVADLGNTRLKWGRLDAAGRLAGGSLALPLDDPSAPAGVSLALPLDDPSAWAAAWADWNPSGAPSSWAIATVNPPVAETLRAFLEGLETAGTRWYRSAADVPIRHALEHVETAGADRALAVLAALAGHPGEPGLVVSCGSAITVERISLDGVWQGGAIAPGLELSARALHLLTAQLPLVVPREPPPAWGRSTRPALEAGLYWGVVGAIREILTRQAAGLAPAPWLVWTGGDAPALAPAIAWEGARVIPDLVLDGLARVAEPG